MSAFIRTCLLSFCVIFIAACSSTPTKAPVLPQNQLARLKAMPLPKRLPMPVKNYSHFSDTWGEARSQGRRHEGVDIMAPRGTKVYSTTDGVVASLKGNNLGGTVVWIVGPGGAWHYYAHLNDHKRGLKEGDYVRQGDLIGYIGNTGNARHTAPHLHYGLYLNGKGRGAVNPYPYLR
ncbi:M23 family metallopeptidase [Acinetobacter sp. WZC-1]|uniref:M23 family metallopeptidase n=1 Tax=Acinetobacter sp. WZC-1 TaxID=3459034 RepID=UPI00403E1FBB